MIDNAATDIKKQLDEMIDFHEKPLVEIEEREVERIKLIKEKIDLLFLHINFPTTMSSIELEFELTNVENFSIDDSLQEFKEKAAINKDQVVKQIKLKITAAKEREELIKLRQEEIARQEKEIIDARIKEAEHKATTEAEKRAEEKEAKVKRETEAREAAQREAFYKQEIEIAKARMEKAEAEKIASEAERVARENAEKELIRKNQLQEQERIKRQSNEEIKSKIYTEAMDAICLECKFSLHQARTVLRAISDGLIPNIKIEY